MASVLLLYGTGEGQTATVAERLAAGVGALRSLVADGWQVVSFTGEPEVGEVLVDRHGIPADASTGWRRRAGASRIRTIPHTDRRVRSDGATRERPVAGSPPRAERRWYDPSGRPDAVPGGACDKRGRKALTPVR